MTLRQTNKSKLNNQQVLKVTESKPEDDDINGDDRNGDDRNDDDRNGESFNLRKKFGLPGSIALIAGTMVGSGIFASPVGVLAGSNGSVGLSLVLWAACGVIAGLASLCYCELGSMIHDSGGEYAYLYRGYGRFGPIIAFTFSWTSVIVTRTSGNAATALTFGVYAVEPFYTGSCQAPAVLVKCVAAAILLILMVINYVNVKASSKVQSVLSIAKFIGMGIIIIGGFIRLAQGGIVGRNNFSNAFNSNDLEGIGFNQIGLAFYQGLWSYEGWNNLNYITEEVKNSKRTIPLAIIIVVPLVTIFYLLVNIGYFAVMTPEDILLSNAVAVTWGYRVLGSAGWVMSVFVCLSTVGALNGSCVTGGRLPFVAARNGHLPEILAMATIDYYTPGPAIIFTTIVTLIFLIPSTFDDLVYAFGFTAWLFYALVIASVLILRFTHKEYPRPYKVPFLIPVVALIIAAYLVVAPLVESPDLIILYASAFILCAPIVYFIFVYKQAKVPGIDNLTAMLQKLFNVAPTTWKNMM